ncbi:hypothetical protein [Arthrobacter sp. ISL-28]|uniref:hypothetical protein n=1 Tax=Arthrobacter sp. ISL-28 TaxID=2819108 RepID=UPI001BE9CE22|nr:hypothetical protein [Arthrobacter sp. ISL-28]MBT2523663.1 hypothetical protein [Arthrobacter sp. ISL-28]
MATILPAGVRPVTDRRIIPKMAAKTLNWAMPESSGILVSAFDSEATGEFA